MCSTLAIGAALQICYKEPRGNEHLRRGPQHLPYSDDAASSQFMERWLNLIITKKLKWVLQRFDRFQIPDHIPRDQFHGNFQKHIPFLEVKRTPRRNSPDKK